MDDRELLELAAKAAEVPAYWSVDGTVQNRPMFVVKAGGKMGTMPYESEWNPLKDDAEAMRLAVKLSLIVCSHRHGESWAQKLEINIKEPHGNDANAATRRAIVRAAAEIACQEKDHDR